MKRTTLIATVAIIGIITISTLSFAGPRMGGRGDCQGLERNPAVAQLTQEKQDLLKTILDEHRAQTEPLRDGMWEKRTLLKALSVNPNTKPETITGLVREMSDLRAQLRSKRDALEARVEKEVGIELPMGPGQRGEHRGMGGRSRDGRSRDGRGGYGPCAMGQDEGFGPRGMGYGPGDGSRGDDI